MGSDRKIDLACDVRLRFVLRAVLYGPGRTTAVADQRPSVSADATDQPHQHHVPEFSRSLLRQSSACWNICNAADQPDAGAEPAAALLARLGLERPTSARFR